MFIDFAEKNLNTKEFTNDSQKILAYTLNNKNKSRDKQICQEAQKFSFCS